MMCFYDFSSKFLILWNINPVFPIKHVVFESPVFVSCFKHIRHMSVYHLDVLSNFIYEGLQQRNPSIQNDDTRLPSTVSVLYAVEFPRYWPAVVIPRSVGIHESSPSAFWLGYYGSTGRHIEAQWNLCWLWRYLISETFLYPCNIFSWMLNWWMRLICQCADHFHRFQFTVDLDRKRQRAIRWTIWFKFETCCETCIHTITGIGIKKCHFDSSPRGLAC